MRNRGSFKVIQDQISDAVVDYIAACENPRGKSLNLEIWVVKISTIHNFLKPNVQQGKFSQEIPSLAVENIAFGIFTLRTSSNCIGTDV